MKDTDLKHLTLKTAFLLALASGKRRTKIHAWVANKVSNLDLWEKVALFPSSDFIAKNQLAREGSQSVSPVTIPALTTIVDRQRGQDPVSGAGPEVLFGSNQRPERVSIPPFHLLQERTDIRPATLSSWLKQTILNKQTNKPLRPLRPFTVGYHGQNHASLSLESSQHIYKFLPKIPYLVRRQQCVSGTSGGGTTSHSFPLRPVVLGKKKKGGGGRYIRYNQVFRSLIPGSRYSFTSQDVTGKAILYFSLSNIICIKDLLKLSLISYSVAKTYENSNHWAGLSLMEGP